MRTYRSNGPGFEPPWGRDTWRSGVRSTMYMQQASYLEGGLLMWILPCTCMLIKKNPFDDVEIFTFMTTGFHFQPALLAFNYHLPIILIWLKYCWKGRKIAHHPSVPAHHTSVPQSPTSLSTHTHTHIHTSINTHTYANSWLLALKTGYVSHAWAYQNQ